MTPDREDLTSWLIALLREAPGGYAVGDHGPPENLTSTPDDYPFWQVWSIPGGGLGGPALGSSTADASFVFQVDSVGLRRDQSGRAATRARERIVGRTSAGKFEVPRQSPSGIVMLDRYLDGAPGAPSPAGDRPNEVWTTSDRFVLAVSSQT